MPDTTTNLGLPFPLATDPFSVGNEDIQALAEALDAYLSAGVAAVGNATQTASAYAIWNVSSDLSDDFALEGSNDVLGYDGPDRFFALSFMIDLEAASTDMKVTVYLDTAPTLNRINEFRFTTNGSANRCVGSTIVKLVAGDKVKVLVEGAGSPDFAVHQFRLRGVC